MACDMPKPCKFSSLDSCQKSFLWTHKELDLARHPVVGLVLQVGDTEKFPHARGFEHMDPFFRVSKQGPCFTAVEEDGGDKRLVRLELACKADGHHQILFSLAIAAIADAILIQTSAEQMPHLCIGLLPGT